MAGVEYTLSNTNTSLNNHSNKNTNLYLYLYKYTKSAYLNTNTITNTYLTPIPGHYHVLPCDNIVARLSSKQNHIRLRRDIRAVYDYK